MANSFFTACMQLSAPVDFCPIGSSFVEVKATTVHQVPGLRMSRATPSLLLTAWCLIKRRYNYVFTLFVRNTFILKVKYMYLSLCLYKEIILISVNVEK
jgi:hypothetical protein